MDRRTPVIVGVGQVNGGAGAGEPVDLIATAVERAIADGGAARIPVDRIGLTKIGTKQYRNAPKRVAERAGFGQARALGLAPDAELTLTGGMRFASGPWNNYTTHMLANLVGRVREEPEAMAVCSANGGLATRFCVTAYSGQPSPDGFRHLPAPFVDPGRRRRLEVAPTGVGHIAAYTIPHDRSNEATHAIAACRLADGAHAWARLGDPDEVREMLARIRSVAPCAFWTTVRASSPAAAK